MGLTGFVLGANIQRVITQNLSINKNAMVRINIFIKKDPSCWNRTGDPLISMHYLSNEGQR